MSNIRPEPKPLRCEVMSSSRRALGSGRFIIRPSLRSYLRPRRGAFAAVASLLLALALLARLARLAVDGVAELITAGAFIALAAAFFVGLVALMILRGRVMALPDQLVVLGLFTTKRVPTDRIERVLLRTISYSGHSVREVLVVGKRGEIVCRVAANFYMDDDLQSLFSTLGFPPEGSWRDIITLGPIEGLSAEDSIAAKLTADPSR